MGSYVLDFLTLFISNDSLFRIIILFMLSQWKTMMSDQRSFKESLIDNL